MKNTQNQFQIIVLEGHTETDSHTLPGPLGTEVTSSTPGWISRTVDGELIFIQILPRLNEQSVDPSTLKST